MHFHVGSNDVTIITRRITCIHICLQGQSLPATFIPLSTISFTSSVTSLRKLSSFRPAYGIHCTGTAYGLQLRCSELIIITNMCVAGCRLKRVTPLTKLLRRSRIEESFRGRLYCWRSISVLLTASSTADISTLRLRQSLKSFFSSSISHERENMVLSVAFPSLMLSSYVELDFCSSVILYNDKDTH